MFDYMFGSYVKQLWKKGDQHNDTKELNFKEFVLENFQEFFFRKFPRIFFRKVFKKDTFI